MQPKQIKMFFYSAVVFALLSGNPIKNNFYKIPNMKKFIFTLIIGLNMCIIANTQVITVTDNPGTISLTASQYVDNMHIQYNINTSTNEYIEIVDLTYMTEDACDFITICECDNNFNITKTICSLSGSSIYSYKSSTANGRLIIIFTSDGSVNGDYYSGYTINYRSTTSSPNDFSANGPVKLEAFVATSPNLTIVDRANKFMGAITSITADYNKSVLLIKSDNGSQLGINPYKISSNDVLGISSTFLYQTSNYSYLKAYNFYFSTPNVPNAFEINDNYLQGIRMNRPVIHKVEHLSFATPSGHACIYFGGAGAGDMWFRAANTIGSMSDYRNLMVIKNNGNIGIGCTSPDYKLDVVGKIRAWGFKVNKLKTADFVFEPGYRLPSLAEVEAYVNTHKHLPGIQPAEDMDKNGVDIGNFSIDLLQKIEELTLHAIAQEKQLKEQAVMSQNQQTVIEKQNRLIEALEKRVGELEKK
jgi:hypothetical protein